MDRWPVFSALALSLIAFDAAASDTARLPDVVVTATRTAKPVDETPVASFVVTAEDMEKRNIKTLDDAINLIPGVFARRGKGSMDVLSEISLRGVPGGKRSLIMIDGLPLNDAYENSAKLGGYAPEDVERVEVALGAGSSLYGSSAMGGVVNFTTRMPTREEYRFKFGYGNGLGTDRAPGNVLRGYLSAGNAWDNGLSLIVSFSGTTTEGYASDVVTSTTAPTSGITGAIATTTTSGARTYIIGDRGDNGWNDQQISLRGRLKVSDATTLSAGYTKASYRYDYQDYATYLRNAAGAEVWSYGSVREASFLPGQGEYVRDIYRLGLETRIGESVLKLQGGVIDVGTNWYTTISSTSTTATRAGGAAASGYAQTPSRTTQLEAAVNTPVFERHLLTWGATWRAEKADTSEYDLADWRAPGSRTRLAADSGGRANTTGAFAQLDLEVATALHAYVGMRYDRWKARDGYADNYATSGGFNQRYAGKTADALSPRLGLVWQATPAATLRASAGQAFRAPSIYDLYRTWKSSTTVYAGTPALEPETMTGYDIGGDFRPWPGADLKLTYFHNDFKDMIYRRTVTDSAEKLSVCGTTTLACQAWINAGRARSRGVEASLRQVINDNWAAFASFTFNDTEVTDNAASPTSEGKQFTQVPRRMASLGADWTRGDWSASGSVRYVARRYNTDANSDVVDGVPSAYDRYVLVDARLGYRINRQFKASVSIDNLTDREYYASYRAPGRSFFVELAGEF
ncbi:TonB-dependent receptor [Methyloversatilis thermotolerans]|uniref:TonB-dependent receptor n=1 Tax=Methyloversatilis thermotolerans TaxID=1346290 RepID=UPI000376828D|nr:TonB-dependent receptor [Methyloversatilis thermotolerans]